MADQATVVADSSWISYCDRKLHPIESLLVVISGLAVGALVLLAVISVIGRGLFDQPLKGYVDWIQQCMPLIAFSGIAYALRNGTHIRMDMLIGKASGRLYYLLELIGTLGTFIVVLLLIWGSWAHFMRSFDWAMPLFSRDSSFDIGLPLWPAKLLVPISFAVLALRTLIQTAAYTKAFFTNPKHAIGVPLIESVTEEAEREAAILSKD